MEAIVTAESIEFWDDCPLAGRDPGMRSGSPVLRDEKGKLTRLAVDDVVGNVEAFMELEGLSEESAIDATLKQFPGTPGGKEAIRSLLAYQAEHLHQLQP